MDKNSEQRICLKFCVLNGILSAKSLKMLQKAYGECALSKTRVYEWYTAFAEGREVVEDFPRSGRPSTFSVDENVDKVKVMVLENHHLSLREVARDLNVPHESTRNILHHQLGMRRVAARLVPRELNFFQKIHRKKVAGDMLEQVNSDPTFIQCIITGDETWVYELDMQTSQQAAEWRYPHKPKPKTSRQIRSKVKVMLLVFFDYHGVLMTGLIIGICAMLRVEPIWKATK